MDDYVAKMGGWEITATTAPAASEIISRVRQFFDLQNVRDFTFPGCPCKAGEAGVLLDTHQMLDQADRVLTRLEAKQSQDNVWRLFDSSALFWYACAHEFAHHLQATNRTWQELRAESIRTEVGADFLAGICIGWFTIDFDINFLSAIDTAWEIGMEPLVQASHPEREQRKLAVSTGVAQGAGATRLLKGDLSRVKHSELLTVSAEVADKILERSV